MSTQIRTSKTLVLQQAFTDSASHRGCCRFLHNKRVNWSDIHGIYEQEYDLGAFQGRVAVIDDTVCLSLNHLQGKLKVNDPDVGRLSGGVSLGQYYHVGLAYDLDNKIPLGLSYLKAYERPYNSPKFEKDTYLPYEERESHRWHECSMNTARYFGAGPAPIRISDREADSYEYIEGCQELGLDFVVRSQHNRCLTHSCDKLHEYMREQAPVKGVVELKVPARLRRNKRVRLTLRSAQVTIKAPEQRGKSNQRKGGDKTIHVVYAQEVDTHLLRAGEKPLEWILLTSLPIDTLEQLKEVIELYRLRWKIEELFKIFKSDALQAESTQLGKGRAIKNLMAIGMNEAFLILTLRENRTNEEVNVDTYFDEHQVAVLQLSNEQLQGKTQKQSNPYQEQTIAWAAWIIARLGAWQVGSPPGAKVISRGLRVLNDRAGFYKSISDPPNLKVSRD